MPLDVLPLAPIAIQAALLAGQRPTEKFQQAQSLAVQGIELSSEDMVPEHLEEIATAIQQTGIKVSAINIGHTRLIHPDYAVREKALVEIRQAMTLAVDLGAQGVVFKPFYERGAVLPDLHPYKSSLELEAELLVTQLRATLCDLAYALGTELLMLPVNHQETHLIRCVQHGAVVRQKLDQHPHLKIAASLFQMALEGEDPAHTFTAHAQDIGQLYIPAQPAQVAPETYHVIEEFVRTASYKGWITLEATPESSSAHVPAVIQELKQTALR